MPDLCSGNDVNNNRERGFSPSLFHSAYPTQQKDIKQGVIRDNFLEKVSCENKFLGEL
jgi:hypothetical protein